jgi:hypothetical protein
MPINLPDNVTLIGNDTPSEAISRNYYTYRNQAVSDAFLKRFVARWSVHASLPRTDEPPR